MNKNELIEIKFHDDRIRPELIRASDLADILKHLDQAVSAIIQTQVGQPGQATGLSLVEIRPGCASLSFDALSPSLARPAFAFLAECIRDENPGRLPKDARAVIPAFRRFNAIYNCRAELRSRRADSQPAAVIPVPDAIPVPEKSTISGETDLFAEVLQLGGERKPRVRLRFETGEAVDAKASRTIVKQLGARIYETVALRGIATWELPERRLLAFEVLEILPYEEDASYGVREQLQETFGKYFDAIDVDAFVAEQREG